MVVVNLEFSGGLELLFDEVKQHKVQVPAQDGATQVRTGMDYRFDNLSGSRYI